jgi:carbohydrate-binding DOMON domain-containing protein
LDGKVVKETTRERARSAKTGKKPKAREIIYDLVVKKETDAKRRKVLDILAVLLTRSHLESFDEKELKKTVDYILERMSGKMTQAQLYQALDKPLDDGGAGLYEPTAKLLTEGVESIIKLAL